MSRASELADKLRQKYSGAIVDLHAADELERLDRVNAELVEAVIDARRLNALGLDCEDVLKAALTSATKETKE